MKAIKSMSVGGKAVKLCKLGGGVMFSKSGKYAALEWLESDGAQYIDTLFVIKYTSNFSVVYDVAQLTNVTYNTLMGADAYLQMLTRRQNDLCLCGIVSSPVLVYRGGEIEVSYHSDTRTTTIELGGESVSRAWPSYTNPAQLGVFGMWENGSLKYTSGLQLRSEKIYREGVLVADLRPARRVEDGELGLYDIVRNIFLTNQGERDLIAGPETGEYY